jgi:PAS domain S-box-containing protein
MAVTTAQLKLDSLELLEDIADGIAVTGFDGDLRFLSRRLACALGIDDGGRPPESLFALLTAVAPDSLPTLHARVHATGSVQRTTVHARSTDFYALVIMRRTAFEGERCVVWAFEKNHGLKTVFAHGPLRLELAARSADFGFWDVIVATDEVTWSNDWCDQHGIDPCSGRGHSSRWDAMIHPDDLDQTTNYYEVIAGDRELYEAEFRVRTRGGGWRWVMSRGMASMRDSSGRALRITGVTIDIDERKSMEIKIRENEARLAMILQTMSEGVVLIDTAGRVEFTNPAFDRMFGYQAGETKGLSILELLARKPHAKLRARAFDRLITGFNAQDGKRSVTFRRRDGSKFPGEVLSGSIDGAGLAKRLHVIRDVRERKLLEKEVTEIAHRERRRIGSDLHDGLGQELTGISLLLRSLAQRSEADRSAHHPDLDEIIGLVNHAIQTTRTLAMGLSPLTLERGGLTSALMNLAAWTRSTTGCEVRLRRALRHELTLDDANATQLYFIAQEAILNAIKHGRARSIRVSLSTTNEVISLAISDDGVGIGGPDPGRLDPGMGLKIMEYRAGVLGGSLRIKERKGGGTRVHCVCPRSAIEPSR